MKRRINGTAVRVIRDLAGIRHMDLAARAGISRGSLTHVESGSRDVSAATLRKIADALRVPLEAISYPDFQTKN
ncbi:DNA-binding transcriptional regulator, XRE-family HTH domain [Arthrobacter woluwensis]|uniref:DNA-binding transcriptional regulator, XRE-family HTH domain n=2 Tax=Arthrobacter woluwensis TaxID=156980 RepID=A0A1H4I4P5_9MICC|nr:DNA-binding transcriptional regulator, XRE-family HTH domain [Arthrobacter woluwensis]SEC52828.1 DNA-binding transcriptional regulator, XRE-family HTH domain [Arthrobacter woluwensis]